MNAYRVFKTEAEAEKYQALVFADLLIMAAGKSDGTVERADTGAKVTAAELVAAKVDSDATLALVAKIPLYGRKADGKVSRTEGISTRWAIPVATTDGQWAVEAPGDDPDAVDGATVKLPPIDEVGLTRERIA